MDARTLIKNLKTLRDETNNGSLLTDLDRAIYCLQDTRRLLLMLINERNCNPVVGDPDEEIRRWQEKWN